MSRRSWARLGHRAFLAVEPGDRGFGTRVVPLLGSRAKTATGVTRPGVAVQQASLVVPAKQEIDDVHQGDASTFQRGAPQVAYDFYGAISMVDDEDTQSRAWQNEDGKRHEDGRYAAFAAEIAGFIPGTQLHPKVNDTQPRTAGPVWSCPHVAPAITSWRMRRWLPSADSVELPHVRCWCSLSLGFVHATSLPPGHAFLQLQRWVPYLVGLGSCHNSIEHCKLDSETHMRLMKLCSPFL